MLASKNSDAHTVFLSACAKLLCTFEYIMTATLEVNSENILFKIKNIIILFVSKTLIRGITN